ncbi:hypothetical protein CJ030_MR7G016752 [Morella rubra]|uniref:Uncharacterized protein n=1 Tax=Morella rubra TaxID=262757 RepID=A0A6A1UZ89_9ROSI|nr:hypothetical protein CJ030_MR7G016752 [Morella rubra]
MERLAEIHEPRNPINPLDLKNDSFLCDLADAYEHFSEGKLNITLRLKILFPFLDKAPSDGVVSFKELGAWMAEQTLERLQYMTEKELASRDRDGDQAISLREYLQRRHR